MKMRKGNAGLWIALLWLLLGILSMFLSVVSYTAPDGEKTRYALQDLIDGQRFSQEVLRQYTGSFKLEIGSWVLTLLCFLAVCAIVAALFGILILSRQRPARWPFVMTVLGVIGTAIPALLILFATLLSASAFPGKIAPGAYPIVTPIAVLLCLLLVTRERKRVARATAVANENSYLQRGGDL